MVEHYENAKLQVQDDLKLADDGGKVLQRKFNDCGFNPSLEISFPPYAKHRHESAKSHSCVSKIKIKNAKLFHTLMEFLKIHSSVPSDGYFSL